MPAYTPEEVQPLWAEAFKAHDLEALMALLDSRMPWALWEPAVKKLREEEGDSSLYAGFEYLYHQGLDFDRKRGGTGAPPTKEELRHFVESALQEEEEMIAAVWKEEPTSGDEEHTKGCHA